MPKSISLNTQNNYELQIYGQMDESWLSWFGEIQVQVELMADDQRATTITGVVTDQAGMVGLIRRLHGLGIVLLSVRVLMS